MIKRITILLASLCICVSSFAQYNMTLFQMQEILQSNTLNPSIASNCKWNVGFPFLGSVSVAATMPISYNSLGAGKDYMDGNKILSSLKNNNMVSMNAGVNLFFVGYRSMNSYYQFSINERASFAASINKDPVELLLKGNAGYIGKTLEGQVGLSAVYYREYALSITHDFGNDTWFGVRARLLFGRIGIHAPNNKNTVSLYTDPATYGLEMNSDLLVRASLPGTPKFDSNGAVTGFDTDIQSKDFVFKSVNSGGAVDLGINSTHEDGWRISASILNIGLINWTKNTHEFKQNSTLNYSGPTSAITSWDDLGDTLKSVIKPTHKPEANYSQWLSPAVMFGASYLAHDNVRLGITGYAEYNAAGMPWAITATALTENVRGFHGALSYTVTNNSFINLGVGIGATFGAFTFHAVTDNIIAFVAPFSQKYGTLQFGMNFRFGCKSLAPKVKSNIPCPAYGDTNKKNKRALPCPSHKKFTAP